MPAQIRPAGLPAHLPYPSAPDYLCGDYRGWSLRHKPVETTERGYFTGLGAEPPGHYLENQGDVWMSTSRLERESHAVHVDRARGTVVVCGVGMGLYLFNVAGRPEVDRVIAVDRDGSTIDLVQRGTGFDRWPGRDKVTFVHADALKLTPADLGGAAADYLYVDIWPELGDPAAVRDTQAIQAVVRAKAVGWWGEELDFVEWVFQNRPRGHVPDVADLRAFAAETKLPPAEEPSAAYVESCLRAAKVYAADGSLAFAVAHREAGEPVG
ncbi:MAG: hypothetical protein JWO31_1525 [Phycisphaerales bacterium]|nr:hypothetical protein [Phycisphaerales bacterium]